MNTAEKVEKSAENKNNIKTPIGNSNKHKGFDYTFKIVLIGDSGVGKSCILLRFADDQFNEQFYATIGVDFRFKNIDVDNKNWDTAGQERFKTITSAYYRGADGILIVYDITDRNSFIHLRDWIDEVNRISNDEPIKLIIGNKCDLDYKKEVFDTDVKSFEEQTGIPIVQVSAKEDIKVHQVMKEITKKLIERSDKKNTGLLHMNTNLGTKINEGKWRAEKSNCCS